MSPPTTAGKRGADIAARHGRVAEALEAAGGDLDKVDAAVLHYRCGEVVTACSMLRELRDSASASERCRAAAGLSEIELCRGNAKLAEALATEALARDRDLLENSDRARLHLAIAAVAARRGSGVAARVRLARAISCGPLEPALEALIAARRADGLARRGHLSDAEATLDQAERTARQADALAVAMEIQRSRAYIVMRRGDTAAADSVLSELASHHRQHGDEIGAVQAEVDLASLRVRRGLLAAAEELATPAQAFASCRGLAGLQARASLVSAAIDVAELRIPPARTRLCQLVRWERADPHVRATAASLLAEVQAWNSGSADYSALDLELDHLEAGRARARIAMAANAPSAALDAARSVAVDAERSGRNADLADALAVTARLELARGDTGRAAIVAARAREEALDCGMRGAHSSSLLVLASLQRDRGNFVVATAYARQALKIACECGLPVERLVAAEALEELADTLPGRSEPRHPWAATMPAIAVNAADRLLADLGLASVRPYRVVSATGSESFVAGAHPDLLRMTDRNLAIDGVRDVVMRNGEQIADLRRRGLLKRLLFLFAGAPGHLHSKEDIVRTVWNVDYHPLNRDAALFTNITRIRRLLGDDGTELIRGVEGGYRFLPPKDFLFVEAREP